MIGNDRATLFQVILEGAVRQTVNLEVRIRLEPGFYVETLRRIALGEIVLP